MLYLIAVPIGNLKDISLRALELFEKLDVLLCEDTRNTGKLLSLLGIKNKPKLFSFYDEVEEEKIPQIIKFLKEGLEVGLVSNAGSPIISDPGWKLVERCRREKISHTSLPGVSAVINALILSGLSPTPFCFLGFLPKKVGKRKKILEKYKDLKMTKVIYESPFRLVKLLEGIKEVFGDEIKVS
ncbi:16S rRNA (cytidine(1402)-2'-O)-methyltransferase, partial [Patescibacteria group bacterium]|nr:16S rRNA (cytidine(1402)-2'-O)-methyltransferase [Patescibacteria group bacterium]